jgi:hypothetical protein
MTTQSSDLRALLCEILDLLLKRCFEVGFVARFEKMERNFDLYVRLKGRAK